MVVLDALHWIQAHEAPDLAVRWNCKAAKCGSCSAEVNGRPRLTCKTRLSDFDAGEPITVEPMRAFPLDPRPRDRRLVELRGQQLDPAVHSRRPTCPRRSGAGSRRTSSGSRSSASASSASCARTSATSCATTRPSGRSWGRASSSGRPASRCTRWTQADRRDYLKDEGGIGYCNITKCCTEVCPEHIKITDNAIIPLKERVADKYYDPIQMVWRKLTGGPPTGAPGGAAGRAASRLARPALAHGRPARRRGAAAARAASSSGPTARPAAIPAPPRRAPSLIDLARPDARDPRAPPDATISESLGVQTNNVAEYTARRAGARRSRAELGARRGRPAARLEADRRAAGTGAGGSRTRS